MLLYRLKINLILIYGEPDKQKAKVSLQALSWVELEEKKRDEGLTLFICANGSCVCVSVCLYVCLCVRARVRLCVFVWTKQSAKIDTVL